MDERKPLDVQNSFFLVASGAIASNDLLCFHSLSGSKATLPVLIQTLSLTGRH